MDLGHVELVQAPPHPLLTPAQVPSADETLQPGALIGEPALQQAEVELMEGVTTEGPQMDVLA